MADEGMPDFDLDGLLDWIYVEDDFPLADELAESQIPDPGYAGTQYEIDMEELDDFDVFDYWDDLQYGDDSYWEYAATHNQAALKRKRDAKSTHRNHEKRQKLTLIDTAGDNVRFVRRITRNEMAARRAPTMYQRESFTLFPDWRKRFADTDGAPLNKEMPESMKQAAEGTHEGSPNKPSRSDTDFTHTNGEVHNEESGDDVDAMQPDLASLDPETLKAILRQKLGAAGLDGMDENSLMEMLGKMLSGEDGADDAVDEMANDMVERATGGNDAALSDWLSQQGVSLDTGAVDEDDADSGATTELPNTVHGLKDADKVKSSPSDSAIEMQKAVVGASTEMAIHPSSPSELIRKRAAPFADAETQETRKRKRVSFHVAASTESITVAQEGSKAEAQEQIAEEPYPSTSEISIASKEPTEDKTEDDNITVVQTRAANAKATANNHESHASASDVSKAAQPRLKSGLEDKPDEEDDQDGDEIVVTAPAPAKNTRKRKAEAEKPVPKKQAKKVSGPAESVGKRTRNTRAAAKAGK